MRISLAVAVATVACLPSLLSAQQPRLHTNRQGRFLPVPVEEDGFTFAIFGDRTGGQPEGIEVLRQAVADVNLLDPDLVMTVGDLIQGYNERAGWMTEMVEFREVLGGLNRRWFPVAGNHDIYWRGADKPADEHEGDYEAHFGPLWYAFSHKDCWFVVLYSDEPNPETGERNFGKPECQRMSPEQLQWLKATLRQARGARHVFVFLHHPRWLAQYGDDWEKVHQALVQAGNVSAVFAGHIHRMRYDGARDGIDYFALATTGGHLAAEVPTAGYLHHFHMVTVRPDRVHVAAVPVGGVLDPREITGEVSEDVSQLLKMQPRLTGTVALAEDGSARQRVEMTLHNPCNRPIELTLTPHCRDRHWTFVPDHDHTTIEAGADAVVAFEVARAAAPFDVNFALPTVTVACDYLGPSVRVTLPDQSAEPIVTAPGVLAVVSDVAGRGLQLDGTDACLRLDNSSLPLPDGAFTLEAWCWPQVLDGRRALVTKTESSEYGIFVSDGLADFSVCLDGRYVTARATEPLALERWHHVAGVFDGDEVRLYVDGRRVARAEAPAGASRTRNELPFYVGADPNSRGRPVSFFEGWIDEVRLSAAVRYRGAGFAPSARHAVDPAAVLLLHMDAAVGPWCVDASGAGRHPVRLGAAALGQAPALDAASTAR
ncbi:MAG: LamG-like jellyroll fold domain-containing protein [Planctomycetota bacterium]